MFSSRTCLLLAMLGVGFATMATGLILYLGGYFDRPNRGGGDLALVGLIALYPSVLASVFFNVALAKAAGAALDGRKITIGDALDAAFDRFAQIALWSLIAALVGLILEQIAQRVPFGGKVVTWIVGAAWGLTTIFVVPILALEDRPRAFPSIRRSGQLLRKNWAEGLSGSVIISFWTVLLFIPVGFVTCLLAAAGNENPQLMRAALGAWIIGIVAVGAVAAALRQAFAVVLYRYATAGAAGGFPVADLERPFAEKKWGHTLRWIAGTIAALLGLLIVIALLNGPKEDKERLSTQGYFRTTVPLSVASQVQHGTPVLYRDRWIGRVVDEFDEGGYLVVVYHLRKDLRRLGWHANVRLEGPPSGRYLRLELHPWGSGEDMRVRFPVTKVTRTIRNDVPVFYRGRDVGYVQDHWIYRGKVNVIYWIEPRVRRTLIGGIPQFWFDHRGSRDRLVLLGSR